MAQANTDIRKYASNNHVMLWEIAEALGIADCNFSRKLRRELPNEEKARIISIVDDVAARRASELMTAEPLEA